MMVSWVGSCRTEELEGEDKALERRTDTKTNNKNKIMVFLQLQRQKIEKIKGFGPMILTKGTRGCRVACITGEERPF